MRNAFSGILAVPWRPQAPRSDAPPGSFPRPPLVRVFFHSMCGLAGLFSLSGDDLDLAGPLLQMTAAVRHRGPDDEGYVLLAAAGVRILGGVDTPAAVYRSGLPYAPGGSLGAAAPPFCAGLGHRRLSILDLSPGGHQPMTTEDGRYWIVFNGEIYNQATLRAELEMSGEVLVSRSDTEVLLKAYRRWGRACLSKLRGMFAFIIHDRVTRTVFAARDRFGIKPLYYWFSPAGFLAFASEIKQFTVLPGWRAAVNGQRAYDFLNWELLDHTEETLFADVRQLRAGEFAVARLGDPTSTLPATRWYSLAAPPFRDGFNEASSRFGRLLRESVKEHLQSDVPLGSCLSGGLDSSSIVCLLSNMRRSVGSPLPQTTFSACAREEPFDERRYVEEIVQATGVEAHYTYPRPEQLFDTLERITWHQDEPFGSTSMYAQWSVFELASNNGAKVMLDGQGADEQLIGYHAFFGARQAGLLRSGRWLSLWRDVRAVQRLHGPQAWSSLLRAADAIVNRRTRSMLLRWAGRHPQENPPWLDLTLLGAVPMDPYAAAGDRADSVAARSLAQLEATSLPMLLHWEDRNSMAHSVESRVPFLDHRLVEFVLGLPEHFKLSGGMTKRVLRDCMKGILPERVRTRVDKMGFVTPEPIWVRRDTPGAFRERVRHAVAISGGLLTPEALTKADRVINGLEPYSFWLWRVVNFGAWMERFGVKAG